MNKKVVSDYQKIVNYVDQKFKFLRLSDQIKIRDIIKLAFIQSPYIVNEKNLDLIFNDQKKNIIKVLRNINDIL